jgi:hypothetical protein|tara:strand:+ start:235 stop:696 length:462 start_codon:yes stop_codon:yes gene_type:complete
MGSTTFSGPIKAGTISTTTGTTVGTDMKNAGQVVMAQSLAIDLSGGAITADATAVIIPANSQIIDIVFDIITAASGTTNISVGAVGGSATAFVNAYTIGTTAGRQYPETKAGGALAWEDVGTSDVRLNVTNSAATSSGEVRLTVLYQQDTNYS